MATVAQPDPYQNPLSQTQRTRWYGEPDSVDSINVVDDIPYEPALPNGTPQWVGVHPLLVDVFVDTCESAHRVSTYRPLRMDSHVVRSIRGSRIASVHSWACAWDMFSTRPTISPPGGVWTPDEHFTRGIGSAEKRIEPSFARFVEAFLEAGFWWGGFFRRKTKPSGQSRGPAGMDTPHFEWRKKPPTGPSSKLPPQQRLLQAGMSGNDVNELIANLRTLGFNIPPGTTTMSPAVIAAVVSIQGSSKLEIDGVYGPLTHSTVGSLVAAKNAERRKVATPAPAVSQPNPAIEKALVGITQRIDFIDANVPKRIDFIRRQVEAIRKENQ